MRRKNLRLVIADTIPPLPAPPPRKTCRRVLHRVETASMDLRATVRVGVNVVYGRLLNVSLAGCCLYVALPLPVAFDPGTTVHVTLFAEGRAIACAAEVVALDRDDRGDDTSTDGATGIDGATGTDGDTAAIMGAARLRLRFRSLTPQTHRALLTWISGLVTRDFQLRYSSQ